MWIYVFSLFFVKKKCHIYFQKLREKTHFKRLTAQVLVLHSHIYRLIISLCNSKVEAEVQINVTFWNTSNISFNLKHGLFCIVPVPHIEMWFSQNSPSRVEVEINVTFGYMSNISFYLEHDLYCIVPLPPIHSCHQLLSLYYH